MDRTIFWPQTQDGWALEMTRFHDPERFDPSLRPLLFVPGYGMNSFILSFHPRGVSMIGHLVEQGWEVWTANLRGQGSSRRLRGGSRRFGFREFALIDIPCARDLVLEETRTECDRIDYVGCSLGATILFAFLAHHPDDHRGGALLSIGGPLRWERIHPVVELAFRSPRLAGMVPIVGTRPLAARALPILRHLPPVISLYMNVENIDLSHPEQLVQTVENPSMYVNRQIAHWIRQRDLFVQGRNVSHAMRSIDDLPVYCILANRDGIVPPETAMSILDHIGSSDTEVLIAGTHDEWFAHADLFIAKQAREQVFEPMEAWLRDHN